MARQVLQKADGPARSNGARPKAARPVPTGTAGEFRRLQGLIGNQAVARIVQAKPRAGRTDDRSERQTDDVADHVMRAITDGLRVQRLTGKEGLAVDHHVWNISGKRYKIAEVKGDRFRLTPDEEPAATTSAAPSVTTAAPTVPDPAASTAAPPPSMTKGGAPPPPRGPGTAPPPMPVKATPASSRLANFRPKAGTVKFQVGGDTADKAVELWIKDNDPAYFPSAAEAVAAQKERAAIEAKEKAEAAAAKERIERDTRIKNAFGNLSPEPILPAGQDYDFNWWFNYMWSEARVAPMDARAAVASWARKRIGSSPYVHGFVETDETKPIAEKFDGYDEKRILKVLLDLGFVGLTGADTKDVSNLTEGPQGDTTGYFKQPLPSLKQAGLVYRSDSREPGAIKAHGGSKARSHLGDAQLREVGLTEDWNPFSDKKELKKYWLRLGNVDNDLQTVVSLAVDPRDAVKFPLPGSTRSDKTKVTGGTDFANLYVIWIRDKQVIDTSAEISKRTGADRFGRGELGAVNVPYDTHLLHIKTERFFDDTSVSYVAGKVSEVNLIQPDSVYLQLPDVTRQALYELIELLTGGKLGWLVHKPGFDAASASPAVTKIEEEVAKGPPPTPKGTDEAKRRVKVLTELKHVQKQRDALNKSPSKTVKELGGKLFLTYDASVALWSKGNYGTTFENLVDSELDVHMQEVRELTRLSKAAKMDDTQPIFDAWHVMKVRIGTFRTPA